jgi:pyridoxal 5'-phosphate synthase pdxS subunit
MIQEIQAAVTIPVMAKARIGHFAEAQILQALDVDYIDESEVFTPADEENHIDKWAFTVPFVCGATNLGEALTSHWRRRVSDSLQGRGRDRQRRRGRAPPSHDQRPDSSTRQRRRSRALLALAKDLQAPIALVQEVAATGNCPCRCSAPAASRRPPTLRSCCNSAPKRCS